MALMFPRLARNFVKNGYFPTDEPTLERALAAQAPAAPSAGPLRILVNNAGITGGNGKLWELPPDTWRRVVEVNLVGPYLACRAVVPEMLRAGWGRFKRGLGLSMGRSAEEQRPGAQAHQAGHRRHARR